MKTKKKKPRSKRKKRKGRKRPTPVAVPPVPVNLHERAKKLRQLARAAEKAAGGDYDVHREKMAAVSRERSTSGRDVGPLPAVRDSERRERGRKSLRSFALEYFPRRFRLAFARPHETAIDRMERVTEHGGRFACAMPRKTGKTTIAEVAVLRAVLYGLRRFVVLVAATNKLARQRLKSIYRELETNPQLAADFPEACYLIRKLERIHRRAAGQTLNGEPTRIEFTTEGVILPTVTGALSSGAVLQVASMEGAIRGLNVPGPDGEPLRPDLIVLDDVQTRDSAKSPVQTTDREMIVKDDILGLSGPDVTLAAVMLCTVIYPNDLSDRFLNHDMNPEWQGVRTKMLESFPTNLALWDQYAEIRRDSFRSGDEGERGNEFYVAHREEMDRGAIVSWPARREEGELSGIQSAMNLFLENPRGFKAEYQNDPDPADLSSDAKQLEEADLTKKLNNLARGVVPRECNRLTAFVDVQAECLFWAVCAWTEKFGGALVDYGVFPQQPQAVFEAGSVSVKLSDRYPKLERGARIYSALAELVPKICGRAFDQDGADGSLTVSLCLIDARFETETIHDFISRSPLRAMLKPSMGRGLKADNKPMRLYSRNPGDVVSKSGPPWRIDAKVAGKGRYVQVDVNSWKTFIAEALLAPAGAAGSFYLPGKSLSEAPLLTLHLLSEYRVPTNGPWGQVEVWKSRPDRTENHWWDGLIGCAVGASIGGVQFSAAAAATGEPIPPKVPRKRIKYSDLYYQKHGERVRT